VEDKLHVVEPGRVVSKWRTSYMWLSRAVS